MCEVLNRFLADKVQPLLDKINTSPEHPEQALTRLEGLELLTDCVLKDMVEAGTVAISEREGEFYFEWKGDQNYVNQGAITVIRGGTPKGGDANEINWVEAGRPE